MASVETNNQEASSSIVDPDQNVLQKHASFFDRNQDCLPLGDFPRASCNRLRLLLVGKLTRENVLLFYYQLGRVGSYVEWKLLYYPGKDRNGLLHKGTERGVYDGSLFHQMEKDHSSRNAL